MNSEFETILEKIRTEDARYPEDAYLFVMEALALTQKKFKRTKHVTGEELLKGISDFLLDKFGPMTMAVLDGWGIKTTEDFGNIVFNLVERRVLSKTEEDSIESFRNVYDFNTVFRDGYHKRLQKKVSRMRSM